MKENENEKKMKEKVRKAARDDRNVTFKGSTIKPDFSRKKK